MAESLIPPSAAIQSRLDEIERERTALKRQLKLSLFVEASEALSVRGKDEPEAAAKGA